MPIGQGIHTSLTDVEYHADPCPQPSFTQSLAKVLLNASPRHAWVAHPRLNPDFKPENARHFDVGSIVHRLLLGVGRDIHVLNFENYRSKEAQLQRARARGEGALPALQHEFDNAMIMRDQAVAAMRKAGIDWKPETTPGVYTEAAFIWQEDKTWLRTKVDRLQRDTSIDFKTTSGAGDPETTARRMLSDGWHIQAAMHERAYKALLPERAHRTVYLFVQQEVEPPFAVGIYQLPESVIDMGRHDLAMALAMWRDCIRDDEWPSYNGDQICILNAPGWGIAQWQARHGVSINQAAAE